MEDSRTRQRMSNHLEIRAEKRPYHLFVLVHKVSGSTRLDSSMDL
jgi:hypothetical protein